MAPWEKPKGQGMIVTTTPTVEGHPIADYLGIVVGEAILGANVFRDLFAQVRDIVGGRSGAYEATLAEARDTALRELGGARSSQGRERSGGRRSRLRGREQHADGLGLRDRGANRLRHRRVKAGVNGTQRTVRTFGGR
jgi:hypothetical protein